MPDTDTFYTEEVVLLEMTRGRDIIKLLIGKKKLRGEPKEYLDLRSWYPDDEGTYRPGKGFAKPFTKEELKKVAEAITNYVGG